MNCLLAADDHQPDAASKVPWSPVCNTIRVDGLGGRDRIVR
jgi:hypothetical protein